VPSLICSVPISKQTGSGWREIVIALLDRASNRGLALARLYCLSEGLHMGLVNGLGFWANG